MFRYRRLACAAPDGQVRRGDVTVLNWGTSPLGADGRQGCGNDYRFGCLTGVSREERRRHLGRARARAQAYLHCLQSEHALELRPRGDLTWTADGIALEPYIREARRGVALTTIRHEDVARRFFPGQARARSFIDSVGIGAYHYLDFHPNATPGHVDLGADGKESLPFTVPLGALIPMATDGLILSAKSIGTTHITNSAYRMHPVEWAIGEAGGRLAAFALAEGVSPRQVALDPALLRGFQGALTGAGVPIHWFNDVGHDDPDFSAIQGLAAAGLHHHRRLAPGCASTRRAASTGRRRRWPWWACVGWPPLRPPQAALPRCAHQPLGLRGGGNPGGTRRHLRGGRRPLRRRRSPAPRPFRHAGAPVTAWLRRGAGGSCTVPYARRTAGPCAGGSSRGCCMRCGWACPPLPEPRWVPCRLLRCGQDAFDDVGVLQVDVAPASSGTARWQGPEWGNAR